MNLETQTAFARRLGVNKSTVHRHLKAGRIIAVGKLIDVDASLAQLNATTGTRPDVAARHAENRGAPIPLPPQAPQNPPAPVSGPAAIPTDANEPASSGSKVRYKAINMHYENALIKLGMAIQRGVRHPLQVVKQEAYAIGSNLASGFARLVDQTAPRLSVMTDVALKARLIEESAEVLRRNTRGDFPRAYRRIRNHGAKQP